jgi:hypothetical protein
MTEIDRKEVSRVLNHAFQPAVTSSFCAAPKRASRLDVTLVGAYMTQGRNVPALMTATDADTTKGSPAWSPPA